MFTHNFFHFRISLEFLRYTDHTEMRGNQNVAATTKKRPAAWQADQLHGNDIPCRIHHAVLCQYIPDLFITKPDILLHGRYGKGGRL